MNPPLVRRSLALVALSLSATTLPGCIVVVGDADREWDSDEWREQDKPARLGIDTASVGPATASQLNINRDRVTLVEEVFSGWPAAEAGLKRYDIITAVNGDDDASPSRVRSLVRGTKPGEELTLRVLREGQPMDLKITPRVAPSGPQGTGY